MVEDERRRTFTNKTCNKLREQSDKQLALAVSQHRSRLTVGKKRTWDMANLGSESSRAQGELDRSSITDLVPQHRQIVESNSLRQLSSAYGQLSAPPNPLQSPMPLPQLAEPFNASGSSGLSAKEVYLNPGEWQTRGIEFYDAPIFGLMNCIPPLTTGWTADDSTANMTPGAAVYYEP